MAKTKTPIRKIRYRMCFASLSFSFLAFLLVFFELMLTWHGGWDDLSVRAIFTAPIAAAVGLAFAVVNIVKYRAKSHEIVAAISILAVSALFSCLMMFTASDVLF